VGFLARSTKATSMIDSLFSIGKSLVGLGIFIGVLVGLGAGVFAAVGYAYDQIRKEKYERKKTNLFE
jgi:hypothetical protein